MRRFEGKNVLITGASEGVGAAAARLFAAEGARLALCARRRGPLEALAQDLERQGTRAVAIPADVQRNEDCARLVETTVRELGSLDVLVNNAGAHFRGPLETRSVEEVSMMVDVNVRAPIVLSLLALPHLRETRGAIVQVGSVAGMVAVRGAATYSGTKAALRTFSDALGQELEGSGVRVSVVAPGPISDTQFLMSALDEASDLTFAASMSTAAEVAALIVRSAVDGKRERATPRSTAFMARVSHAMPFLVRLLRPVMEARGRKARARLRAKRRVDSERK